jgi:hypothetical protein
VTDGPMDRRCEDCGKPSTHTIGMKLFYCCRCWVALGMPPATWHPECLKAKEETCR